MSYYFQLLTPRESIIFGKDLKTAEADIRPGLLLDLVAGGVTVAKCAADGVPFGFAFGARAIVYAPTTEVFASGEVLAAVGGQGEVAMGSDFFSSGSIPTVADAIVYAAADGLLATTGSVKVGRVIRSKSRTIVGGTENVVVIRFNIQP